MAFMGPPKGITTLRNPKKTAVPVRKDPVISLENIVARSAAKAPVAKAPVASRGIAAPYSGGGAIGGGGGIPAPEMPAAPEPPRLSDDDFLASGADAGYMAQMAALQKALENYQGDYDVQRTRYDTDYNTTLKDLGRINDDPATPDIDESGWNFKDQNTASGRSYQNQQNDFAGRGLLQSSLYGEANNNLTRSLNDQFGGLVSSRNDFRNDQDRQRTVFQDENQFSQKQARAEAIARRAAGIGV